MRLSSMDPRCSRRRGQSAVEVLLLLKILLIVFIGMYYLFTVTFAAQNAHIRAREWALHGATYLGDRAWQMSGSSVWDVGRNNYRKADTPLSSGMGMNPGVDASSSDRPIPGLSDAEGPEITAHAYLYTQDVSAGF